ncbi:MAG: hypothetical protein SFU85_11245 [Candidatus Methylacidiphilales bacterium]|nr:hypothetical protein [Candidatus Methylacidiphilales bacterium]
MERRVVTLFGAAAVLILSLSSAHAQADFPPPPPRPGAEDGPGGPPLDGPPGEGKGGMRPPKGGLRHLMPFKPFLMAGSPQFGQMLKIALLPPERVQEEIQNWPKYQEMDETGKEDFHRVIERFRQRTREEALAEAREQKWAIPAGRENEYVRFYWEKRIAIETRVRQQAEEQLKMEMGTAFKEIRQRFPSPPAAP